jgi:tRNA nucleotidyltransferase (CCA-adding enzyme)
MEVALTHEQADFDALAALLCIHLIDEKIIPVLPNRVNRNVREFLNLYGADFPFIEPRDLAAASIDGVTLVDTQSLVTLKGITTRTRVSVIDHHNAKEDLSPDWNCRISKMGATTTILVDMMREQNPPLSMIQTTLLLLGIYEDTGSLTYASTTVRDVKAAAYLLEKGASLRIAADYLNPSLSEEQRKLADRLLENARSLTIHGKHIIVSNAIALDLNEEISSIAHKMRDLLDPDALFLIVRTPEGIRLVARSTSDQINVARIAHRFGGGGHERAAAALLQASSTEDNQALLANLNDQLIEELSKSIKPPLTVSKIMSRRPHLMSPSTSLQEAAGLMQRYGYEGYPVVENDKVVGLLTRRAVDRAVSHKLNLNAGSLMEAGEYTLKSTDTIDQLHQLMAATGWGQIPVVDPESGKIIGIVTRTDLLKTLPGYNGAIAGQKNYASMLDKALPPLRLALLKMIANFSGQEHQAIYIVGGFVRDLLLERPSIDFDVVVEGDAIAFAHSLERKFGGRVVSHRRFGTAKWQIESIWSSLQAHLGFAKRTRADLPDSLDFISARTEFYDHPSALPTVERSSIQLDLHRRDFTINTLALRLDGHHYGELYDYWGGLADLEKKQVRVLHSLSFVDDPTRLLRAVRFEQRFQFQIEKRTRQLMSEAREMLKQLSGERIHHEFDLIFNEADPISILQRLQELDLLEYIHPKLKWEKSLETPLTAALNYQNYPDWDLPALVGNTPSRLILPYLIWLIPLSASAGIEIGKRLRLSNQVMDILEKTGSNLPGVDELKRMPPSRFTAECDKIPILGIFSVFCLTNDAELKQKIEQYAVKWRKITPSLDGNALREKGIPQGPQYSRILTQLREAWLDGKINSKEDELTFLEKILT